MKTKTVKDLRHEVFLLEKKLRKFEMKNKLADQYRAKITYMLLHFRLIPCKKTTLKNWRMPDYNDIINLEMVKND
jgi:hypothetical protein